MNMREKAEWGSQKMVHGALSQTETCRQCYANQNQQLTPRSVHRCCTLFLSSSSLIFDSFAMVQLNNELLLELKVPIDE